MKRKPVEDRIYELKETVKAEYFKVNPSRHGKAVSRQVKKFPDDFLSKNIKKELAVPIEYPNVFKIKSGITITGRDHKIRRKMTKNKINLAQIKKACEIAEKMNEVKGAKYAEILLPGGKLKLTAEKRFGIGFDGSTKLTTGGAFIEFDTLERAKYLLYARRVNQYIYKVPKNEIVVKRAVQKYEKYVKETRSGLVKAFMEKGANKKGAEGLAGLVMGEVRLQIIDFRL